MKLGAIRILVVLLTAASAPALGHHSHANYWETEWVNLEGTVQAVHWMNPHSWVYIDVAHEDDAMNGAWALEGASVTSLRRDGWAEESIQVGDTLTVRCHPLKDGSRGCLMGFVVMDDGSEKEFD